MKKATKDETLTGGGGIKTRKRGADKASNGDLLVATRKSQAGGAATSERLITKFNLPRAGLEATTGERVMVTIDGVTASGIFVTDTEGPSHSTKPIEVQLDGTRQRVWVPRQFVKKEATT